MLTARIRKLVPSAIPYQSGVLENYQLVFTKTGTTGSAKANLVSDSEYQVPGILFKVAKSERGRLNRAERGYEATLVTVKGNDGNSYEAFTYISNKPIKKRSPFSWYKQLMLEGASEHGLPGNHLKFLAEVPSLFDTNTNRTLTNLIPLSTSISDSLIEGAPSQTVTYKSDVTVIGEVRTFFGNNPEPVGGNNVEIAFNANPGFTFFVSFVIKAVSTSNYKIDYSFKDSSGTNHPDTNNPSPISGTVPSDNETVVQIKLSL